MSRTPSYEYEVLHQFEAIFRDGEHKTQAATRDYQRVWENVINNPPEDGVTPVVVYRMNGRTCAAIAGLDDLVDNEECAMEIARLAARVAELEAEVAVLSGTACAEEQAEGNGPCGVCRNCAWAERDRLRVELEQRRSVMSRLPFCSDHRDKVAGLECRECEVERLRKELEEAGKAILWMHEMYPTKALRNNEWSKAVRRALERGN